MFKKEKEMATYSRGTVIQSNPSYYNRVDRYVTKPLAGEVTPYLRVYSKVISNRGYGTFWKSTNNAALSQVQATVAGSSPVNLTNQVYDKLREKIYESLQLANDYAERKQTLTMVSGLVRKEQKAIKTVSVMTERVFSGATKLYYAYRALRRGRFRDFLRLLEIKAKKEHKFLVKSRANAAAGLWLEYWFGWSPILSTIYDATKVLTGNIPSGKNRASKTEIYEQSFGTSTPNPSKVWSKVRVSMGATFTLVNSNSVLLGQMGVVNPFSVVWAAIPFSFLVEWLGNVQQVLDRCTDYTGVSVRNAWTTKLVTCKSTNWTYDGVTEVQQLEAEAFQMVRTPALQKPVLHFALPRGLSVTRGATAVALLLQVFNK